MAVRALTQGTLTVIDSMITGNIEFVKTRQPVIKGCAGLAEGGEEFRIRDPQESLWQSQFLVTPKKANWREVGPRFSETRRSP